MKLNIPNIGYMPRWLIICMDVFLIFFSIILSYLLRHNFITEEIKRELFVRGIIVTVSVYLACFIAFKSYTGIIRHTSMQDTVKLLITVFAANVCLVLLNIFFIPANASMFVPYSILYINFFTSFFMLAGSRIIIKEVFEIASKRRNVPVMIFGAGDMGLTALKAILQDKTNSWKVVALIDDNPAKKGKNLAGITIYSSSQINKLIKKYKKIERVIIAANYISVNRRNEIASLFIEHGIKVSVLPPTQQWLNDSFKIQQLRDIKIEDLLEREPIQMNNQQINIALKGKRILITGAAGSIGSEIVRQVSKFDPEILLLCDIAESPLHEMALEMNEKFNAVSYKPFIANITDVNRMEYIFQNFSPNIVFHAAAYKHVPMMESHSPQAVLNNISGTRVIADLSVKYDVERFVMISTDKAVNPTNVMGASKRIAEIYIQALQEHLFNSDIIENKKSVKTLFITTRFGNVMGSNGSVIPRFKSQLEKGGPITVTHPDITRFFMTIPEACQLVLEAGVMGKGGEIFVFDMGKSVRITDLAKKMISLAGLKVDEDIKIVFTGLRPGEKLYEELLSVVESTLPTYHEKIKIAQVKGNNYSTVKNSIAHLIAYANEGMEWECVKIMKEMVPEFISNNSKFGKLDTIKDAEHKHIFEKNIS